MIEKLFDKKFLIAAGLVSSFVMTLSSPALARHHRNDASDADTPAESSSALDSIINGLVSTVSGGSSSTPATDPAPVASDDNISSHETEGAEDALPDDGDARPTGGIHGVASAVLHKEDAMEGRSVAVVRVLDRITSQTTLLEVPVGQSVKYERLTIEAVKCLQRPSDLPYDSVQYLKLTEDGIPKAVNAIKQTVDPAKEAEKIEIINSHEGWFLAKQPGVTAYESALYDVHAVRCAGDPVAPFLEPLPAPTVPVIGATGAAHVDEQHTDATQLLPKDLRDSDAPADDQDSKHEEGLLPPVPDSH